MKKLLVILICILPFTSFAQESTEKKSSNERIYTSVEVMLEFPGGEAALMNYLVKNIKYPSDAQDAKIQGKVFLTFVVSDEGKVKQVKVLRGLGASIDAEAIRVVQEMPDWKPGTMNGKPVNVQYNIPINFRSN